LYGFTAISTHNGWAMAIAGALIVFAGLVVLSAAISQLHKILMLLEKKDSDSKSNQKFPEDDEPEDQKDKPVSPLPKEFPTDLDEIACLYKPLIDEIGETFYLSDLYEIARKNDFPHPHITFTAFRESEILVPCGDGVFSWNPPTENEDNVNG